MAKICLLLLLNHTHKVGWAFIYSFVDFYSFIIRRHTHVSEKKWSAVRAGI
jgi:hypothetical protein